MKNNVSVRFKDGESYKSRSNNSKRKQGYSTSPGDDELYLIEHFFNEIDKVVIIYINILNYKEIFRAGW